jgi:hypothetical protein
MITRLGGRSAACLTLLAAVAATATTATPATAQNCGVVRVAHDLTLQRDLQCALRGPAIIITADGVTLDLNGHSVRTGYGVAIVSEGHDRVTVRNGRVETQGVGIQMSGRHLRLEHLRGFGDTAAFELHDGAHNVVSDVDFSMRGVGPGGLLTRERGDTVTGSRLIGLSLQDTRRTTVSGNSASAGSPGSPGITVTGTRNRIVGNSLSGSSVDGIDIQAPGNVVGSNVARDNGGLGILAVAGTIDAGDNHASGNADPRQCVGVVCTP